MSLQTPTTAEISANIIAQLEATLNQTIPLLPKSFLRVLAKTLAAVFILLYKYGGFTFLQIFVSTASINETTVNGIKISPLIAWGRLIGVGDPVAATQAELLIDITVENQVGSLPSGSQLINADNGVTYITIGTILLDAATVQATIRAVSDQAGGGGAGAIGNLEPGDIVSFANPLANVARDAVVDSQVVTGADGEGTEVYRQRIIDRFQKRPQGGASADYEIWGEEVAGIINIFPYTGVDPGEVDVYVEATVASSGDPDGIPTGAQLQAVADSIELDENGLATRRPANAFVNVFPITRTGFDTVVSDLSVDNPSQVQSDITNAITEFFLAAEPFVDGLTIPPRKDRITQSGLIGLVEDIVTAANGTFTTVTFTPTGIGGSIELYILGQGEKAKSTGTTFI
ncbi:baseplate J/gp47 family protein [Candidatus Pacearchaeota archaeon]|nr:baseplate J/gp47 family protein [Candidatus Pacearchaeota archaeon]